MRKFLLVLFTLCAVVFAQSQQSPNVKFFTDSKAGKKYKIFDTDDQSWFIQDLGNYNWDNAMKSCPTGWRLPADEDWKKMEGFLAAHPALWEEFRKSAKNKEKISGKASSGFWWSATESEETSGAANFWFIYDNYNDLYGGYDPKEVKRAVRCVKDL